jgi:hypothetical protein
MTRVPVYSAGEVGDPLAETPKIILGSEQAAPSSARRGDAREGAVVRSAASCVCDSDYIHIISTAIRDTHTDRSTRPMCVCVSDYIHSNTQHAYRSTRPETWGPGKWRPREDWGQSRRVAQQRDARAVSSRSSSHGGLGGRGGVRKLGAAAAACTPVVVGRAAGRSHATALMTAQQRWVVLVGVHLVCKQLGVRRLDYAGGGVIVQAQFCMTEALRAERLAREAGCGARWRR